ncbi:MAG: MarR family transcriptional regulator [Proteobacteria bacterium]|nr:MarR family transcriptional regulator [Pseudomonadota bacterium]
MAYDAQQPSKIEAHVGYWLRCLSNFVSRSFAEKLAIKDVTVAQWVVVRTLYDYEKTSLKDLARTIGVDSSSLSRTVERLVQRMLIIRTPGKDRRSIELALSVEGKRLVLDLARLADQNDDEFFHTLSKNAKNELLNIVQQLLKANGWDQSTRGQDRME